MSEATAASDRTKITHMCIEKTVIAFILNPLEKGEGGPWSDIHDTSQLGVLYNLVLSRVVWCGITTSSATFLMRGANPWPAYVRLST